MLLRITALLLASSLLLMGPAAVSVPEGAQFGGASGEDLPQCLATPEPLPVLYNAEGTTLDADFVWPTDADADADVTLDFGDGTIQTRRVTSAQPGRFTHTYDRAGQRQVTISIRGTVDGEACQNEPYLLRSVVTTGLSLDNLCIDRVPSEVTVVRQIGEQAGFAVTSTSPEIDYTVTVQWPFETTETRVVGEGQFPITFSYDEAGRHRPVLYAAGVNPRGECSNPATIFATIVIEPRLFGPSRTETAVTVSRAGFADAAAGGVVLARQDTFPDALAGAAAAAAVDGPLLLTTSSALHPAAEAELRRVLPAGGTVHLLGGTAALSDAVAQRVQGLGYTVERLAGSGREATAAAIAEAMVPTPQVILLATGSTFPDALLAGAVAARIGGAVLLTGPAGLTAEGRAYVDAHPGVPVVAVGGDAAAAVASDADEAVVGADQYATAVMLAQRFPPSASGAGLASGESFPDGLAGGAHLARLGHALLLTAADHLPSVVEDHLRATSPQDLVIFGGPAAISTDASTPARELSGVG